MRSTQSHCAGVNVMSPLCDGSNGARSGGAAAISASRGCAILFITEKKCINNFDIQCLEKE